MITKEEYLKSLSKLEEREKFSILANENGKDFELQYKKTLELIQQNNKQILLLFYMSGCDGCNIIKYLLDNDTSIKEIIYNKYELLMCNITNTKTNLIQKYNIYSYPTCFIIDANEKIVKKKIGIKVINKPENDLLDWFK